MKYEVHMIVEHVVYVDADDEAAAVKAGQDQNYIGSEDDVKEVWAVALEEEKEDGEATQS